VSLGNLLALVGLAIPLAGAGYHYQYVHLPAFKASEAETNYARCLRECREVCEANGIPKETCKCDNCDKYLRAD
jgi:hypothetical protein